MATLLGLWLDGMRMRKSVHPLLLEPTYWRNRLEGMSLERQSLMITPRPDLSGHGREVVEFGLRAHDGERLWGLFARPSWRSGPWPARIRSVGPADRPEVDADLLENGQAEFVFQEPAGRRLEDRVLDVVRICQVAFQTTGIDRLAIRFDCATDTDGPDEYLIAEQLFAGKFC